jgi:hypothetical protein
MGLLTACKVYVFLIFSASTAPLATQAGEAPTWVDLVQADTCPLDRLLHRIEGVRKACCVPGGDAAVGSSASMCTNGDPPPTCSLGCAATFVPLYDDCRKVLAAYFDSTDGIEDKTAKAIDDMNHRCLDLEQDAFITVILQMNATGCTIQTGGIVAVDGKTGRRAIQQIGYAEAGTCSFAAFESRVAEVNANCCDDSDDDDNCHADIPNSCDLECAAVWGPFLTECEPLIKVAMPGALEGDFAKVTATCDALPKPLMIAAIRNSIAACDCVVPLALKVTAGVMCSTPPGGSDTSRARLRGICSAELNIQQLEALYSLMDDDGDGELTVHEMIDLFDGINNDALLIDDCDGNPNPHHCKPQEHPHPHSNFV